MGKIILKGYYVFGNFGDDILMVTTYELVKEIFPSHEIIICSESNDTAYINTLLGSSVRVVTSNANINSDWIIHGGGGVFFDFKKGTSSFYWLNKFIKFIGFPAFRKSYNFYRRLKGQKSIEAKHRAGLGIGVGTYTPSSSKFYIDILSLSDFDFLSVRDDESLNHISNFHFDCPIYLATDLAFLSEFWNKNNSSGDSNNNTIGFVLRDWSYDNHAYLKVMLNVLLKLQQQHIQLKLFSFDKRADQYFIQEFSHYFPVTIWDPAQMSIPDFLREISKCRLMVSSRAHGAIVAACLGIPTLCLAIEPKLEKIYNMLKNSSQLIEPSEPEKIISAINNISILHQDLHKATVHDAQNNRIIMTRGVDAFKEFITKLTSCEKY